MSKNDCDGATKYMITTQRYIKLHVELGVSIFRENASTFLVTQGISASSLDE